ncbi:Alfin, N-terminal [Dillenia turbinata]|uniref:Alfin, N-terminal n=1 Tax=Dillenia turbinata TaxID=194707 RepID=A0AAN8V779_9MAGN
MLAIVAGDKLLGPQIDAQNSFIATPLTSSASSGLPPELLEPALGINFARDGMQEIINLRFLQINHKSSNP